MEVVDPPVVHVLDRFASPSVWFVKFKLHTRGTPTGTSAECHLALPPKVTAEPRRAPLSPARTAPSTTKYRREPVEQSHNAPNLDMDPRPNNARGNDF